MFVAGWFTTTDVCAIARTDYEDRLSSVQERSKAAEPENFATKQIGIGRQRRLRHMRLTASACLYRDSLSDSPAKRKNGESRDNSHKVDASCPRG